MKSLFLLLSVGTGEHREKRDVDFFADYPEHYRFYDNTLTTFDEARRICQSIGFSWDVAIVNSKGEYEYFHRTPVTERLNLTSAYWMGFKNDGTRFGKTIYGRIPDWTIKWIDNKYGDEECVTMEVVTSQRGGKRFKDANCGTKNAIICENHSFYEACQPVTPKQDPNYSITFDAAVTWQEARDECQTKGSGWDLAVPNSQTEMDFFVDLAACHEGKLWLGMQYTPINTDPFSEDGTLMTVDNQKAVFDWDKHYNWRNPEPSNEIAITQCVRMRGNLVYDKECDSPGGVGKDYSTPGRRPDPTSHGYICEFTQVPTLPPTLQMRTPESDPDDECLPCKHNDDISWWWTSRGCSTPSCEARLGIVDAWKIGDGKNRPKRYGFIGKIKIPEEIIDSGTEFSVLIRFSKKVTHGHFQFWNMKFWNFYNGGYEVLMHSKYWKTDRHDPYSVGFVADELNVDEYPELLFWRNRQTKHGCFQPSMHQNSQMARSGSLGGAQTSYENVLATQPDVDGEYITSVKFKNGKVKRIKQSKKYQKSRT